MVSLACFLFSGESVLVAFWVAVKLPFKVAGWFVACSWLFLPSEIPALVVGSGPFRQVRVPVVLAITGRSGGGESPCGFGWVSWRPYSWCCALLGFVFQGLGLCASSLALLNPLSSRCMPPNNALHWTWVHVSPILRFSNLGVLSIHGVARGQSSELYTLDAMMVFV